MTLYQSINQIQIVTTPIKGFYLTKYLNENFDMCFGRGVYTILRRIEYKIYNYPSLCVKFLSIYNVNI